MTATAHQMLESVSTLVELAVHGLAELYDPQSRLFSYQFANDGRRETHVHQTFVYSAITALGLHQARLHDCGELPADEPDVIAATVNLIDQRRRPGDIGLLLWADAKVGPHHSKCLLAEVEKVIRSEVLPSLSTMELAWLLTGLCYLPPNSMRAAEIERWAQDLWQTLESRHCENTGLFVHRTGGKGFNTIRNRIANFADQIYSVYALTAFHERFDHRAALSCAIRCVQRLCQLQGPLGQWWWLYQATHGLVASRYPVYGVHQDGMAPMALKKLASLSDLDFSDSIGRGLDWLFSQNELGIEMVDRERGMVCREIKRRNHGAPTRYATMLAAECGMPQLTRCLDSGNRFVQNREMFSYHLGWLLYAFADGSIG